MTFDPGYFITLMGKVEQFRQIMSESFVDNKIVEVRLPAQKWHALLSDPKFLSMFAKSLEHDDVIVLHRIKIGNIFFRLDSETTKELICLELKI